jgi:hypothetical protein
MRLYLDTNVYSMLAERGDASAVRSLFRSRGVEVLVSGLNLLEIWAIPSRRDQRREADALLEVATEFEGLPLAYRHCREVLAELRHLRPEWVRRIVHYRKARAFLAGHLDEWHRFRDGWLPDPGAYAAYRRDAEAGGSASRAVQRLERSSRLKNDLNLWLVATTQDSAQAVARRDLNDPEQAWRIECLQVWHNAIVNQEPASRDYIDYLGPYLRPEAFADKRKTADFWLREVDATRMPLNRSSGLAHYFQLAHKITHGNPGDILHTCYLLDVDVFVTADTAFANVLSEVQRRVPGSAQVAYILRGAASTLEELQGLGAVPNESNH